MRLASLFLGYQTGCLIKTNNEKNFIIRMSSIGDIVLSTSFIQSVKDKFPNSEIHFLIKSEFVDIIKSHSLIDISLSLTKNLVLKAESLGKTSNNNYDIIYDIHSVFRTRVLSFFLRNHLFKQIKKPRLGRFMLFYAYQNFEKVLY